MMTMHISFRFRFEIELKMEKTLYKAEILNKNHNYDDDTQKNINIEDIMNR